MKKLLIVAVILAATVPAFAQHKGALESHDEWMPKRNKVVEDMIEARIDVRLHVYNREIGPDINQLQERVTELESKIARLSKETKTARNEQRTEEAVAETMRDINAVYADQEKDASKVTWDKLPLFGVIALLFGIIIWLALRMKKIESSKG